MIRDEAGLPLVSAMRDEVSNGLKVIVLTALIHESYIVLVNNFIQLFIYKERYSLVRNISLS